MPLNRSFWKISAFPTNLGVKKPEKLLLEFKELGIVAMPEIAGPIYPGDYPIRTDFDRALKSKGYEGSFYADYLFKAFWGIKPGDRIILTHELIPVAKGTATSSCIQNKDQEINPAINYNIYFHVKWDDAIPDNLEKIDTGGGSFKDISDNEHHLKGYGEFELKSMTRPHNKPLNLILCGPPGTGKTYRTKELACEICLDELLPEQGKGAKALERAKAINECFEQLTTGEDKARGIKQDKRVEFITFHPNYDYSDFIEGYRPNGGEGFDIVPGVLREIAARAAKLENQDKNFLLIIDEINRGNIAKIFGETITLLEEDKRDGGSFEIKCHLPLSKQDFCLPPNLYILGTMNTADRSIAMLDIALRRRFEFEEVGPNPELLKGAEVKFGNEVLLQDQLMENLNKVLLRKEILGNRDYQIGHAWFAMPKWDKDGEMIKETAEERGKRLVICFSKKIIPLLQEWMYETPEKLWGETRTDAPVSLFAGIFGEEDDSSRGLAINMETDEEFTLAGEKIIKLNKRLIELSKKLKTS